jgi:hypothetical protein
VSIVTEWPETSRVTSIIGVDNLKAEPLRYAVRERSKAENTTIAERRLVILGAAAGYGRPVKNLAEAR